MKKRIFITTILALNLNVYALASTPFEVFSPSTEDIEANADPMLGQLQPVAQINLAKGYHLLDAELNYSQWAGDLPADQENQLAYVDNVKSHESSINLNYAYGLFRYTYLGLNIGFLQRSEADFNFNEGPTDPEFYIGQHFPWDNGNFRLSVNASPSLGKNKKTVSFSDSGQIIKGNALRGGYKIKPAAAVYSRIGPVILGSEASYTYFGRRIVETENPFDQTNNSNDGPDYHYFTYGNNYDSNNPNQNTAGSIPYYSNSVPLLKFQDITGGNIIGLKFNFEVPTWQRLGLEWNYNQIQTAQIELGNGYSNNIESYNQNKFKVYARLKLTNQMSLIPEINWVEAPPEGVLQTVNNQNIWLLGLTYRSKFN